jgi:hypothetical protein
MRRTRRGGRSGSSPQEPLAEAGPWRRAPLHFRGGTQWFEPGGLVPPRNLLLMPLKKGVRGKIGFPPVGFPTDPSFVACHGAATVPTAEWIGLRLFSGSLRRRSGAWHPRRGARLLLSPTLKVSPSPPIGGRDSWDRGLTAIILRSEGLWWGAAWPPPDCQERFPPLCAMRIICPARPNARTPIARGATSTTSRPRSRRRRRSRRVEP